MTKKNCWEFRGCERQRGGSKEHDLWACPASTELRLNGVHDGKNGGRCCWAVSETLCADGGVEEIFRKNAKTCEVCEFSSMVRSEEGGDYCNAIFLRGLLSA